MLRRKPKRTDSDMAQKAVAGARVADPGGVRRGTATRRAGQRTAAQIVEAALEVLGNEACAPFSMRAVAEQAGVSLANLQYYYPSRDDLLHAVFAEFGRSYAAAYEQEMAAAPDSPRQRFEAAIRWNLQDISQRRTRQTFVRLWELLGSLDGFTGRLWGELYEIDIGQLAVLIRAMHPSVSEVEIRLRATFLAAMIEGLMIVQGESRRGGRALVSRALAQAFVIADGIGDPGAA